MALNIKVMAKELDEGKPDPVLLSSGSKISRTEWGFRAEKAGKLMVELKWDLVGVIVGETRICAGQARLCINLYPQEAVEKIQVSVSVDEGFEDWKLFNETLAEVFPGFDKDWAVKCLFEEASELADLAPAYSANPTIIWERSGEIIDSFPA